MSVVGHSLKSGVDDLFYKLQDDLCNQRAKKIIISYRGAISYEFIDELVREVEASLFSFGTSKEVINKVSTILIYSNQYFKQFEYNEKLGSVFLLKSKKDFTTVFTSILRNEDFLEVERHLNLINNMPKDELNGFYQKTIESKLLEGVKFNCIFDLIVVHCNSGNELTWDVHEFKNGTSMLSLEVNISRNQ